MRWSWERTMETSFPTLSTPGPNGPNVQLWRRLQTREAVRLAGPWQQWEPCQTESVSSPGAKFIIVSPHRISWPVVTRDQRTVELVAHKVAHFLNVLRFNSGNNVVGMRGMWYSAKHWDYLKELDVAVALSCLRAYQLMFLFLLRLLLRDRYSTGCLEILGWERPGEWRWLQQWAGLSVLHHPAMRANQWDRKASLQEGVSSHSKM